MPEKCLRPLCGGWGQCLHLLPLLHVFTDSLLRSPELVCSGGQPATGPEPGEPPPKAGLVAASLQANGQQIKRLFELRASGYRKLSPIALGDSTNANATALAFITGGNQGARKVPRASRHMP